MKILVLHGYYQSSDIISKSIHKLFPAKEIKAHNLEFVIPNGTTEIVTEETDPETGILQKVIKYGWWPHPKNGSPIGCLQQIFEKHEYTNVNLAIEQVLPLLSDIDVVIGFSQGAVFATILLGKRLLPKCQLAILLSGSDIMDHRYLPKYQIEIKSVHFMGQKDTLVDCVESLKLAEHYHQAEIENHQWGHVIPTSAKFRNRLLALMLH